MPLLDLTALDLDAGGRKRASEAAPGGQGEAGGFLEALLDTPALKEAGIDETDLKGLLDALGGKLGGEGLPLDGEALPAELEEVAPDLDELSEKLQAVMDALAGMGEGDAEQALAGLDPALLEGLEEADPQELSGKLKALLEGETGKLERLGAWLEGQRQLAAERAEVLQALAELEDEGLSGKELVAALQERLAHLDDPELVGDSAGEGAEQGGLTAIAASASALIGSAPGDEADAGRGSALGDQIARELRAGGLLNAPVGGLDLTGGQTGSQGGQSGSGERSPAAEALLQALQPGQRGSDEGAAARGEFSGLLAAAQGLDGSQRGGGMQFTVPQPVGQPNFTPAVGERVMWMVNENVQQARLQLNPPGLGPLDIQVNVGDERTTVNITAHNAATREALEQDLERLRQLLADQGQGEVEVNISQGEGGDDETDPDGGEALQAAESEGEEAGEAATAGSSGRGLVDHYA